MRARRWLLAAAATALLAAGTAAAGGQAAQAAQALRACQMIQIPVSLAPGGPVSYQVTGQYCQPYGQHGRAIAVMVPGLSYDHTYFDSPVDAPRYSLVDDALLAGVATLAIDRIGTGASSKPPSADISLQVDAFTLHEVFQWARDVAGYSTVDGIGHSLGSGVLALDASQYPADATSVVLTGFLHELGPEMGTFIQNDLHAASADPVLAGTPLGQAGPGYVTTIPGVRGPVFYHNGPPDVIAWDEASKDIDSFNEATNGGQPLNFSFTGQITARVLLAVGQYDSFFCTGPGAANCSSSASVYAEEAPDYPAAASLGVLVIPNTGHDLALSQSAPLSDAAILAWLLS